MISSWIKYISNNIQPYIQCFFPMMIDSIYCTECKELVFFSTDDPVIICNNCNKQVLNRGIRRNTVILDDHPTQNGIIRRRPSYKRLIVDNDEDQENDDVSPLDPSRLQAEQNKKKHTNNLRITKDYDSNGGLYQNSHDEYSPMATSTTTTTTTTTTNRDTLYRPIICSKCGKENPQLDYNHKLNCKSKVMELCPSCNELMTNPFVHNSYTCKICKRLARYCTKHECTILCTLCRKPKSILKPHFCSTTQSYDIRLNTYETKSHQNSRTIIPDIGDYTIEYPQEDKHDGSGYKPTVYDIYNNDDGESYAICPLCSDVMDMSTIQLHASTCLGKPEQTTRSDDDENYVICPICSNGMDISMIQIHASTCQGKTEQIISDENMQFIKDMEDAKRKSMKHDKANKENKDVNSNLNSTHKKKTGLKHARGKYICLHT